jgi:predicted TIM-barrel fold metal-dependent hydrolase
MREARRHEDRWQPDRRPRLPLQPGPVANGEFVPRAPTAAEVALRDAVLDESARAASRAGMDRRRFLTTAGGVAAALTVFGLAGCSSGDGSSDAARAARSTTSTNGFAVPPPEDVPACAHALAGTGEFVFDMHTHHVVPDGPWRQHAPDTVQLVLGMLPPDCQAADPLECVNRAAYLHDVFLASDTTVALLSDVPNSGPDDAPVPYAEAVATQQLAAELTTGGAPRLLLHNVIAPNVGELGARLDDMSANVAGGHVAGFKVYTAWGPDGRGWALDDPAIGLPVVQHAHDLGVRAFFAHKGLPLVNFDAAHNGPDDIVAVSRLFPDMDFVVFHGAWDSNHTEGPYDPTAAIGIDTLLQALDRHGVAPNGNVWVDLGSVWRQLLTRPDEAAHALGKLLARVGTDRVLWGTDAIWYGGPQPQLMAFRAFTIGPEYQERFGYPELTDEVKRKVLGLNAAALFGLDPEATRCALANDPLATATPAAAELRDEGRLPSGWTANAPVSRRDMLRWLATSPGGWSPFV